MIMILSRIVLGTILLQFSTSPSLHGALASRAASGGGLKQHGSKHPHHPQHRQLQTAFNCASREKKNACPIGPLDPCQWSQGSCVPKPSDPTNPPTTAPPSRGPTSKPTDGPTRGPTGAPTVPGIGYCSDDGGRQCWEIGDCVCGGGRRALEESAAASSSSSMMIDGRALQGRGLQQTGCSTVSKKKDCDRLGACGWIGGSCRSTTNQPTDPPVTSAPTREPTGMPTKAPVTDSPTGAPTPCACLGLGPTRNPTPPPTGNPTASPTNSPTNVPTRTPTKTPTVSPTPQPTGSPSTSPTDSPTGSPTTAPTKTPTKSPTPQPTGSPSTSPTDSPTGSPTTAVPTESPTPQPTSNPTNPPSKAPTTSPTLPVPTNQPTTSPTNEPTSSPTDVPTRAPTKSPSEAPTPAVIIDSVGCPPVGSPVVPITAGLKGVTPASGNTFCGIFLRKTATGALVPLARSYKEGDWEAAPGPLACPVEDVNATSVFLPELEGDAATEEEYVILSKSSTMEDRKQIAMFLEMTTFGPKMSEIDALDADGTWSSDGANVRARYVREQMDRNATSHREYWRKRTNAKWDATAQPARSSHPCSPNSKWTRYTYTRQDRFNTITGDYIYTSFETVPEEAHLTTTIYETDRSSDVLDRGSGNFESDRNGFSGSGFYNFAGTGDFIKIGITMAAAGTQRISFRYANGSKNFNGNRPCQLWVNDVKVRDAYDFVYTTGSSNWMYSELIEVSLNAGSNTIELRTVTQSGPDLDHLRIGKPPAVAMKTNGWTRAIAKNGIHLQEAWPFNFTEEGVFVKFDYFPDPPQGDIYKYSNGRIRVTTPDDRDLFLDIGNPPVDFTGYEQYLPPNVFYFTTDDQFEETGSDLFEYPVWKGQELLLTKGSTDPVCGSVPPFAEEGDAPIIGKLPSGEWIQWTPTILLEDNGPSINAAAQDMTSNVLSDGGGESVIQTGEKMKCSNVARSFINEDTCFLSTESTACSSSEPVDEVVIPMNTSNIIAFYDLADKYVYAIRGLVMEDLGEHACEKTLSRWEVKPSTTCSDPTPLASATTAALENAITSSSDSNEFIKDVTRTLSCANSDIITAKINIQIQVDSDCYEHVHPDHYNVYDFSGWVTKHPGGEYNIQKWAQGWEGHEGWYLNYPFDGDATRNIPEHPMSRWYNKAVAPNVVNVARLGDSIAFRDLPNDLKTDAVAEYFGAVAQSVPDGSGVIVCGSMGEVSNDPALPETFDVNSNEYVVTRDDELENQKQVVWMEVALTAQDQLRQRMAWALNQIVTTVPANIDGLAFTEIYTNYYDIFVKNAFNNYRDILAETSWSPLMAEHLSYLKSKSHAYVYQDTNKLVSRADENFAREVMQLFSIGLIVLNDDGTPALDPLTGNPLETYTNEDIESLARAWTGFERVGTRSNYEDEKTGTTDNRLDPMRIIPDWRDPFPKSNLNGGFIGDGYVLCKDLPAKSFLKVGAGYRLLGAKSSPELMKDPTFFADDANGILRVDLDQASSLYQRLYNEGNYELFVELENDLDCTPNTIECEVDTVRVVKIGSVYYEFVERPCVQMPFYDNAKQIHSRWNELRGHMCANPDLAHAREACCREDRYREVRDGKIEFNVTYLYEGERMTYGTAKNRCVEYGQDLCFYEEIEAVPIDDRERKGYHWTNRDCSINVKVNGEGYVAIVHDAMQTYKDNIPWHVEEENTLNWFRVFWDNGTYPGDSEENTCGDNDCKTLSDGSCLCKTTVTESVVFSSLVDISKEDVISQLFIGALGPQNGSTATNMTDGLRAHTIGGNVDGNTVFEVHDKGRIMFLKNLKSTVGLEGWAMLPQIYEAESATISNALVSNETETATGGLYVEARYGDDTTYIEWEVEVPSAGMHAVSLRYGNDYSPRPLRVITNTQEITRQLENPNPLKSFENVGNPPGTLPLQRCGGDCDGDADCDIGLFCMQLKGGEEVPGCSGSRNNWDYCADINDFDYGFTLLPTGGWTNDWFYSKPLEVNLVAGPNTIRVQIPPAYNDGPNIDHLKIEGLTTSTSTSSFRNPPHFMSLIADLSPGGIGEKNLRDAQYETDAVLDHYFYQNNVAPFLCTRVMQRFSFSNPSPRFVSSCVEAFRTGLYTSGSETFGSGEYGSLEAMLASILLDREATEDAIVSDPSHGSVREPMLKVTNLMRSMEYETSMPDIVVGNPIQATYNVKLWQIDNIIGQGPYDFPTVFSFFLPEYVPDSGPNLVAKLTSPETMVAVTMPNAVGLINGMFSLIKYGLSDCNDGFSTDPGYNNVCNDNGLFQRSYGHLMYQPNGDDSARASDLALLLTAGRLSEGNLNTIVDACSSEPDQPSKNRCMQQLIVTTGEFHSTNPITQSGEDRVSQTTGGDSTLSYKAIVYFNLAGGMDSYNMLVPYTCDSIDVYGNYEEIRGSVALPKTRLLEIQSGNPAQPCTSFGIHENLPVLKNLYDNGELNFVANAGLLAKPVSAVDYRGETPVQLFAHNAMVAETQREDLADEFVGTGVGGRMVDVLTQAGIPANTFSIDGQQVIVTGEAGEGPAQIVVSGNGVPEFNADPSINNMNDVIKALNNATTADSGFYAETWSSKFCEAIDTQQTLKAEVDATTVTFPFPDSSIADQFAMVTRIMQTRINRGSKRDIFYVEDSEYDTHSNVDEQLVENFSRINGAMDAFVDELKHLELWESTVVIQFSEFARTLDPNTGDGTDHGWGGNHFMFGGAVNGTHVLGHYPIDFNEGDADRIALSRGRMIPTTPWDAVWKGTAEWYGIPAAGMDKVLPMHNNFPLSSLFSETELFNPPVSAESSEATAEEALDHHSLGRQIPLSH